jgi:hypothetical protein
MTRCNGSCKGGRAILVLRTPAGETGLSAERERLCWCASASTAAYQIMVSTGPFASISAWTALLWNRYGLLPTGTLSGRTAPAADRHTLQR